MRIIQNKVEEKMPHNRHETLRTIYSKKAKKIQLPQNNDGSYMKASEVYGSLVFDYHKSISLSAEDKELIEKIIKEKKQLSEKLAHKYAKALLEWAMEQGATHFCHWFQPLTGETAEKHDAFLHLNGAKAIEELSVSQLIQGEPDASSFPNGGFRNTYEARGYTCWDLSSAIFIREFENGKVLYIPTGYVAYNGHALDVKTPLLRSIDVLSDKAGAFYEEMGVDAKTVSVSCGAEQEYFLIDKDLYFQRPDLVMTGRSLLGCLPVKNQQLNDHYFGSVPSRVLAFMNELDMKLYKLGIPAKTRHNEVAPGQFELASIYKEANETADNNHVVMSMLKETALDHGFVCLLHEKPFAGMNGSGKHLNWSMATHLGKNLLSPSHEPHKNYRFLATVAIVMAGVFRHSEMLRASIAGHSNDHRLGAHEAPPAIISVFLGDTLTKIFESLAQGEVFNDQGVLGLDLGAKQLAHIFQDNTDRNRTSPFAFTGNKFEFRAVGSSASIGIPLAILNGAVADIFEESLDLVKDFKSRGQSHEEAFLSLAKHWYLQAKEVVFNGDGYSEAWIKEAEKRGLSHLKTSPEAFKCLKDSQYTGFLTRLGIFKSKELETYANVFYERYNTSRNIEFETQCDMINRYVLPYTLKFKTEVAKTIGALKNIGEKPRWEKELFKEIDFHQASLMGNVSLLKKGMKYYQGLGDHEYAEKIIEELLPLSQSITEASNKLEEMISDEIWGLPTIYEMLFMR